jgi:hypothetical protein
MKKETKDSLISLGIALVVFSLFLGFLLIMGCASTPPSPPSHYNVYNSNDTHLTIVWAEHYSVTGDYGGNSGTIAKLFIPEDNTTCYTFDNYEGGGISCLAN